VVMRTQRDVYMIEVIRANLFRVIFTRHLAQATQSRSRRLKVVSEQPKIATNGPRMAPRLRSQFGRDVKKFCRTSRTRSSDCVDVDPKYAYLSATRNAFNRVSRRARMGLPTM
jgi:hypothetical protein